MLLTNYPVICLIYLTVVHHRRFALVESGNCNVFYTQQEQCDRQIPTIPLKPGLNACPCWL